MRWVIASPATIMHEIGFATISCELYFFVVVNVINCACVLNNLLNKHCNPHGIQCLTQWCHIHYNGKQEFQDHRHWSLLLSYAMLQLGRFTPALLLSMQLLWCARVAMSSNQKNTLTIGYYTFLHGHLIQFDIRYYYYIRDKWYYMFINHHHAE